MMTDLKGWKEFLPSYGFHWLNEIEKHGSMYCNGLAHLIVKSMSNLMSDLQNRLSNN